MKWRKPVLVTACLLLLAAGGISIYIVGMINSVKQTVEDMYEPLPARTEMDWTRQQITAPTGNESGKYAVSETGSGPPSIPASAITVAAPGLKNTKPFVLLVLGVDERSGDIGRADSIVVMAVNPDKQSVLMVSIPRDTRTEMVGRGTVDKINHSYAFGGTTMAVRTVENLLGLPIDYYVKTNMEGVVDIVDQIGGIEVDNEFEFVIDDLHFQKGSLLLDGKSALGYSRMRKEDPQGDIGRTTRQRNVLMGLIEKSKSFSTLVELPNILTILKTYVKTNLTWDDMNNLFQNYRPTIKNFSTDVMQGNGVMIDSIYYYAISDTEKKRVHDRIVEQMQPPKKETD